MRKLLNDFTKLKLPIICVDTYDLSALSLPSLAVALTA